MTRQIAGLLTAAALAAFSWPAAAEEIGPCGGHAEITSGLGKTYGESPAGFGVLDDGWLVELFASQGGTWSLLVTWPDKTTCLVAAGEGWHTVVARREIAL